jgi:hypothetical protein
MGLDRQFVYRTESSTERRSRIDIDNLSMYWLSMAGGNGKRKKRRAKGTPDNPAQSERFVRAAKELGLDESGKDFEEAMRRLARQKRKPKG